MKVKFRGNVNQGEGFGILAISKRFKLGFGFAKAYIKPVFCYKHIGYDTVLEVPTVLRHVNILRFKNYAVGLTLSIPIKNENGALDLVSKEK